MAPLVPSWPRRSTHQANIEPDGTPHACGPSEAEESHDEPRHVALRWSQPVHSERRKRNPDQHERAGEVRVLESPTAVAPEWLEADKAPPEVMFRIAGHGVSITQKPASEHPLLPLLARRRTMRLVHAGVGAWIVPSGISQHSGSRGHAYFRREKRR